jgi:hypothetical protein
LTICPVTKGDWGRDFSPSVFCFAKSTSLVRGRLFVGKRYAINIEAEKRLLSMVANTDKMGIKKPATSIVAAFADMGG